MDRDSTERVTGVVKTPQTIDGTLHLREAEVAMKDGRTRRLAWNAKTRLASVFDEKNDLIGWTERQGDGSRQVVLAGGDRPRVAFKNGLFSNVVWIEGEKFKSVMSLEGSKRVFGNDRLRLEHRDFKSEVRFLCVLELEVAAIIVAFEVYWSKIASSEYRGNVAVGIATPIAVVTGILGH